MIEYIIVGIIVAAAAFFTIRHLRRAAAGKERCAGCRGAASSGEKLLQIRKPEPDKKKSDSQNA